MNEVKQYAVWDKLNSSAKFASFIEAFDAQEAARIYGEQDCDGLGDGLYTRDNAPMGPGDGATICVQLGDGPVEEYAVCIVEFEPVFGAVKLVNGEPYYERDELEGEV